MQQKVLGAVALALINAAAIISLRNLPLMAPYGYSSIFFYLIAAVLFFIPTGLACAELATGWPKAGGVYLWVKEAFGDKAGFVTIWFAWMLSAAWFPAILSFIATTLAYIFNPALANDPIFMMTVILVVFWGATIINFLGIKTSSLISSIGFLLGTLLPGILVIAIGCWWAFSERQVQISYSLQSLMPDFDFANIVLLAGVLLGFAGMELAAFHAQEAKNPQRDYPRAMLLATVIILSVSIFGTLAIAFVVPSGEIGLIEGIMQAFSNFFNETGMPWLIPVIALMAIIGSCAGVNTWIIGPVKGMLPAAEDGFLPKILRAKNEQNVPTALLIAQALIGSVLSLSFVLFPNVNTAYWVLTAISTQFALIMYIAIFLSVLRLRYTQSHVQRAYKIPGGKIGVWLVTATASLVCMAVFVLSFVPPARLDTGELLTYEGIVITTFIVLALPPFLLIKFCRQQNIMENTATSN